MTVRSKRIVVALIAFLAFDAALIGATLTIYRQPAVTYTGTADIGGPFTLIDTGGNTVTDRTYRGKWLLIYFGYTFCPDACPTALNTMGVALDKLGSEAIKFQPLFITVDPKRDTREVMAEYLKPFDSRIIGLTGTQAQTDSATRAYRVYFAPQKTGGDDYMIDHSAYFYVMSPAGKFVDVISGDTPGEAMAAKLRKLMTHPALEEKAGGRS